MNKEKFEEYLESIGGLENGYFTDREPIKESGFFCVGGGWFEILKNLIDELIADGWDKKICQVKEKFGGLRFYTNGGGENHYNIISKYEKLSYETCEECGKPGEERGGRWIKTLCKEHCIESVFENFKKKHKEGFTDDEIKELLKRFPEINMDRFNDSMFCNTCAVIDDETVNYNCDVRMALYCGM